MKNSIHAASSGTTWTAVDEVARALMNAVKRTREQASKGNLAAAIEASEAALEKIRDLQTSSEEIRRVIEGWRGKVEQSFLELEADLRTGCAARAWKVDGSWPSLFVERAILVEVRDVDRTATVNGVKLRTPTIENVLAALDSIVATLLPKKFQPQVFIDQLAAAYDDVRSDSAQTPVFDVYRSLILRMQPPQFWRNARADRFASLTVEQFRARLSASLEASCLAARDGRRLSLFPPLDPKDAIFLYQPSDRRFAFVGRIAFT